MTVALLIIVFVLFVVNIIPFSTFVFLREKRLVWIFAAMQVLFSVLLLFLSSGM